MYKLSRKIATIIIEFNRINFFIRISLQIIVHICKIIQGSSVMENCVKYECIEKLRIAKGD